MKREDHEMRKKINDIAVSVVVPIYNVESWLAECLDSLEKQTLKNIEVILVNDGSTDNSKTIAEQYASRNDNFTLISRKNGGLSAARNTGLDMATGEYIYFLDSDDYILEGTLERLYSISQKKNLDVLKFVAYMFMEPSRELNWTSGGGYKYKGQYPEIYKGIDALQMFIDNGDASYPSCCLIFSKREIIERNNLRFREGIVNEDNLFHWQLMSLSERVAILNEPLYCRRLRAGSITQTYDWLNRNRSMCISVEDADAFIEAHPEIKGLTTDRYVYFFISSMIENWKSMSREQRRSLENKEYFRRIKSIAKKYKKGGQFVTKLFFSIILLYIHD